MGRNKNDDMVCDVCGCITGHMTLKKPPERPADECQRCYWTRELTVDGLKVERDAAIARAEALLNSAEEASMQEAWAKQQQAAAERSRDELGIQLAAQSERLRLAMAVVEAARVWSTTLNGDVTHVVRATVEAIAALDAVPGDALAPQPTGLRAAIRAHLEALGIDTDNVTGGG
jgi:hypothetical protein